MSSQHKPSRVFVILGMHRSGTSLVARYLQGCGVSLGIDLLGKHESNPAGHFEDQAFLQLHNAILAANQATPFVEAHVQWKIDSPFRQQAAQLINERSQQPLWGWKDPRTCLFVDLWKPLLPADTSYVICIRPHQEVVRSLISREVILHRQRTSRWQRLFGKRHLAGAIPQLASRYLRTWIVYNEMLLRWIAAGQSNIFVVSFSSLNLTSLHTLATQLRIPPAEKFDDTQSKVKYKVPMTFAFDNMEEEEATRLYQKIMAYAK